MKDLFIVITIAGMLLAISSPNVWIRALGVLVAASCGMMTGLLSCKQI